MAKSPMNGLVNCDRIPGVAGMTIGACMKMYLSAEKQTQASSQQTFAKGFHPVQDGPLQWCNRCPVGKERSEMETGPVENGKELEVVKSLSEIDISIDPKLKTCITCGELKPISDFPISKNCKGGREHGCKMCKKKRRYSLLAPLVESRLENKGTARVLQIAFLETDQMLFDGLVELARIQRRTPEQQVLWILENRKLDN